MTLNEVADSASAGLSFNQVRGRVSNTIKKLRCSLGEKSLSNVLYYKNKSISEYMDILDNLLIDNSYNLYKFIGIELPLMPEVPELDDKSFEDFIDLISPYTVHFISMIKRGLTPQMLGHFRYLIANKDILNEKERSRYNKLLNLLD